MTSNKAFTELSEKLQQIYEKSEAENIADWVLENITGKKKWERRLNNDFLNDKELEQLKTFSKELMTHKPVQYVLQESFFCGLRFFVNENVLIPRPETEELVKCVIDHFTKNSIKNVSILEVGTGSGCIAIAIKSKLTNASLTAIDKSQEALEVAKRNSKELDAEINFLQVDFLDPDQTSKLGIYDAIVSNPPYIPIGEKKLLDKNVADFEPGMALFVPENDPLLFYKEIIKFSKTHLLPQGKIFVETHESFAHEIKSLFEKEGFSAKLLKDIFGKPRIIKAETI